MNMLKKTIPPRNSVNRIRRKPIMFLPLTEPEIKQIVVLQIKSVQKMLSGNGVELVLTNAAIDFLANAGYDPEFGARPVKRAIQHYLLNDLSKKLLAQEVDRSKPITVDANTTDDGLVFRIKKQSVSPNKRGDSRLLRIASLFCISILLRLLGLAFLLRFCRRSFFKIRHYRLPPANYTKQSIS